MYTDPLYLKNIHSPTPLSSFIRKLAKLLGKLLLLEVKSHSRDHVFFFSFLNQKHGLLFNIVHYLEKYNISSVTLTFFCGLKKYFMQYA